MRRVNLAHFSGSSRLPRHPRFARSDASHPDQVKVGEGAGDEQRVDAIEAAAGTLDPATITPEMVGARLPSLSVGDPDLIIRTGGEFRISNFLLYGAAYAELAFMDRLWPDFTEEDLFAAIASYQRRERRFGLVGKPQPAAPPTA